MTAPVLFCTDVFWDQCGDEVVAIDPTIEVVRLIGDQPMLPSDLARITIAFFSPDVWPDRPADFMRPCLKADRLEWLQTIAAGTDHSVYQRIRDKGALVTNGVGAAAPSIAETVMMYLLALGRGLPRLGRAQAERRWDSQVIRDLAGMRLGIVGFGAIGAAIANLADAFDMETIGLRRTTRGDERRQIWGPDRFDELLGWADAIVVAAPLNGETRGLFDERAFTTMRPGSWFINVGRGEIVDEPALIAALDSDHIAGAGLDVFATEPLPADSPLWILPNVIITPHSSARTARTDQRAIEIFYENLRRRTAGDDLVNLTSAVS
jgi:D-2-hydroxyacid dehydrogenase (NADP+)